MLVYEYRISLPFTINEFKIGQLYMISKYSRQETSAGDGFQNIQNKEITHPIYGKCRFTEKRLYFGSRIPEWASYLIPSRSFYVSETSHNFYPRTVTEYSCSFLPIQARVDTVYVDNDCGEDDAVC